MAVPGYGYEERYGWGLETTYGTPVTPTSFHRALTNTVVPDDPRNSRPSPSGFRVARVHGAAAATPLEITGLPNIAGTITEEVNYDHLGLGLANAMRVLDGTSPDQYVLSGVGPYTHTMLNPTGPQDPPTPLTMIRYNGQQPLRCKGGAVDRFQLTVSNDGPAIVSYDVFFQGFDNTTAGTPSFNEPAIPRIFSLEMLHDGAGTDPPTTAIPNVQSATLTIENNLRRIMAGNAANVRGIIEPIENAQQVISLEFTVDWDTDTYQGWWDNDGTTGYRSIQLKLDNGASDSITIDLLAARALPAWPPFDGGQGPILQTLRFEAAVWNDAINDEIMRVVIVAPNQSASVV